MTKEEAIKILLERVKQVDKVYQNSGSDALKALALAIKTLHELGALK